MISPTRRIFSERLRELRGKKARRLVYEELGLSGDTLCTYESGRSSPQVEQIVKLCQFYHVSADYLLGLSSQRNPEINASNSNVVTEPVDSSISQSVTQQPSCKDCAVVASLRDAIDAMTKLIKSRK